MRRAIVTILGLFVLASLARGEVRRLPNEELAKLASDVVVGKVTAIYSFEEIKGELVQQRSVAQVEIAGVEKSAVEKGDGLKAGGLVYARFFRTVKKPPRFVGTAGHDVPVVGTTVRVYLKRAKDGGYDAILPNGIQPTKASGER